MIFKNFISDSSKFCRSKLFDKLENLPKHIGTRRYIKYYDRGGYSFYRRYNYEAYIIGKRIIKHFVGKPFDDAFSKFKKETKGLLNNSYEDFISWNIRDYNYRNRYNHYIINDDGNIQYSDYYLSWRNKKKSVSYKTKDYTSDWFYKDTNCKRTDFEPIYKYPKYKLGPIKYYVLKKVKNKYWWKSDMILPLYRQIIAKPEDFVERVLSGKIFTFSSRKDPKYMRLVQDNSKPKHKKKKYTMSEQQFREILNKRKNEDNLTAEIKMIKHGFDPKNKF